MTTPLQPDIALEPFPLAKVCNTCGSDDETVQLLRFRWRDVDHRQDGGTGVALCAACRRLTRKVLDAEAPGRQLDDEDIEALRYLAKSMEHELLFDLCHLARASVRWVPVGDWGVERPVTPVERAAAREKLGRLWQRILEVE